MLNTTHAPEQLEPAAILLASILIGGASKVLRALLCTLRDLALISLEPMKAGKSQLGSGDEAEMSERPILRSTRCGWCILLPWTATRI